jgi:OOP family OmpA-OmpF porin
MGNIMNLPNKTHSVMLIAVLTAGLTPCLAQAQSEAAGWYLGAGVGQASSDFDVDTIVYFSGIPFDDTGTDTAFKIFGGYQFGNNLGVELGYIDMGEISTIAPGPDTYTVALSGFDVFAVGILPIGNKFSLFGKLGFISWSSDATVTLAGVGTGKASESDIDLAYGLGAKYNFTRNFGVQAEYEGFDIDVVQAGAGNSRVLSLSATYKF